MAIGSILDDVKKMLDIPPDYNAFDDQVLMHTNSAFATLSDLGVGPEGFEITGAGEQWEDFLGGNPRLNSVRSYIGLRVRMIFDPPATSFHTTAMQEEIRKMEWYLHEYREQFQWVPPVDPIDDDVVVVVTPP